MKRPFWATIAPWFHLRLPSSGPGFESQVQHLCFFDLYFWNWNKKRTKINEKETGIGQYLMKWNDHLVYNKDKAFCNSISVTRWLYYFSIFGHQQQWKISPIMYQISKSRLNVLQIRNKLSKFCQRHDFLAKMAKFRQIWSHWTVSRQW